MPSIPLDNTSQLPSVLQTPTGLAILEIQGTLHLPPLPASSDGSQLDKASVGRLEFPLYNPILKPDDTSWMKRVYLYVGHHQRLSGEVKKIPNPIAIIKKKDDARKTTDGEELEIVEIVKWKVIFSSRPEPVGEETPTS
ncbi:MAG: hypothetical protein M1834_002879 [Cirrosporium novae-zelandiae]|nr:MAG: hypothetical protein M1834_002879 [Cirrosporium novae-zelandiae]